MVRVAILDTCPVFMHGLADLLSGEGMTIVATTVSPAESGLRRADLLLVDPEAVNRLDVAGYVAECAVTQTVLVLAAHAPDEYVDALIHAGATAVIGRREPVDAMVRAIRTAVSGQLDDDPDEAKPL